MSEINVFRDRKVRNQGKLLVDDRDTGLLTLTDGVKLHLPVIIDNLPGIGSVLVNAGKHLHQRGFAGAVFSHQTVDLSFAHTEADIVQCSHAGKFLCDTLHL